LVSTTSGCEHLIVLKLFYASLIPLRLFFGLLNIASSRSNFWCWSVLTSLSFGGAIKSENVGYPN
jgi:hypothetical protein